MTDRTGQSWRLTNLDRRGDVTFVVLRSTAQSSEETEHEILVCESDHFEIFDRDVGNATVWWESDKLTWEMDPLYRRLL